MVNTAPSYPMENTMCMFIEQKWETQTTTAMEERKQERRANTNGNQRYSQHV